MAPTSQIILCRHSQAEHNVELDYSIPDAPLTPLGKEQSAALAPQIPELQSSVEVIITSALKRTLQSTKLGWGPAIARLGIENVVCLPQAQECNDYPCDTGSAREVLEKDPEVNDFNFELLTPDWTSKKGFYAPDAKSIANRARWVRQYLRDRPEHKIVLVAHGDILRQITATARDGPSTYNWKNAEVRIFEFDPASVDTDDCFLYQKEDVAAAGGHDTTSSDMPAAQSHELDTLSAMNVASMSHPDGDEDGDEDEDVKEEEVDEIVEDEEMQDVKPRMAEPPLDKAVVARDSSIFRPDGLIVFPRSDGDPGFVAPNTKLPHPSEKEVNYYHVFTDESPQSARWRKSIGQKLAFDHFNLPKDIGWQLAAFPKDYQFAEQRKGFKDNPRTDPYLFGSNAHRFRSTNEFVPHAIWLLTDPSMNPANCLCKYCHKGDAWHKVVEGSSVRTGQGEGRERLRASGKPAKKLSNVNSASLTTQPAPKWPDLPGVPTTSNADRDRELRAAETRDGGESEGHRRGEFASMWLSKPIEHREDGRVVCTIPQWPVKILNVHFEVDVERAPSDKTRGKNFSLEGRVKQRRTYDVSLLGTNEMTRVDDSRLVPALLANLPADIRKIGLGTRKEHSWVGKGVPDLGLENGGERPPIRQIILVLAIQTRTLSLLRSTYVMTDVFKREAKHGAAPPVVEAIASTSNGVNRSLPSREENTYLDLDDDDSSARRRRVKKSSDGEEATATLSDTNSYWQGMYFGVERIWVCDVVRLRLGKEDVEVMMKALAEKNDLDNPEDRHNIDVTCPYVMFVKAIYRGEKANAIATDDKLRVAGDVYKVVEKKTIPGVSETTTQKDGSHEAVFSPTADFYEPERPFVDSQRKDRGIPKVPWLPQGFALQRVNRRSVEVVCAVQQLSGRMWPSLVSNVALHAAHDPWLADEGELLQRVRLHRQQSLDAHEDSVNTTRVRISLTGLITGAAKAMEVDTYKGLYGDRDASFNKARASAEEFFWNSIPASKPAVLEESTSASASSTANGSAPKRPLATGSASANGVKRQKGDDPAASMDSTLTTLSKTPSTGPSLDLDGTPLPPNWKVRHSKTDPGKHYYANIDTRETSWERPT